MKTTLRFIYSIIGVAMISLSFAACDPTVEAPQGSISLEEATTLENEYQETRYQIIVDSLDIVDTRDFWFSLDRLKEYIAYVEQEAGAQGLENLGIRIYLGAYPEGGEYPDPGFSTVFLVPTAQQAANDIKQGFLPFQPENENIEGIQALNYGTGGRPPNDI